MHILIIHQAFAALDEPGGTRHYELARHLVQRGHKVTIIASTVSYITGEKTPMLANREVEHGLTILRAYTCSALHKSFVHRTFAFFSFMFSSFFIGLGVKNVDLVWGTSPPIFQGWTAWLLARLKRIPFLFEVRDLWPAFAIAVGVLTSKAIIRMAEWLERFLYSHADRVMVNSPGYLVHVNEHGAHNVELIPNGADPEMFDPADNGEVFRSLHMLEGKFVVLYAGAHGMSNDLGVVLEAASLLKDQPAIQVVLLGDGKEKPTLQKHAEKAGLANVTFLPSVPKSRMAGALAGADACIAILKPLEEYKTTYPNKVFDYMCAGRPVILAIDGVIRTVVEAAKCGIFVQPGDPKALAEAIRFLVKDLARSRRMGRNGRRYVELHFSRSTMADNLVRVMEDMIACHSISRR